MKCQWCGKDFPRRHPSQRFCTHKGIGNCKDAFHNDKGPRRRMSRLQRVRLGGGRMRTYHEALATAPFDPDAWMDDLDCEDPGDDIYYGHKDEGWAKP